MVEVNILKEFHLKEEKFCGLCLTLINYHYTLCAGLVIFQPLSINLQKHIKLPLGPENVPGTV